MATYTHDGEVYDAEDDTAIDINELKLSDQERRQREILQVHPFLERRRVIIKACAATKKEGWTSGRKTDEFVGKEGVVVKVHDSVTEAVEVKVDGWDAKFWHHLDLEMVDPEPLPEPVLFNPLSLVIGE